MSPMPTHEETRALGDPQLSYLFNFKVISQPSGIAIATQNDINLRCRTTDVPSATIEKILYTLHGHDCRVNGKRTYSSPMNIEFIDFVKDMKIKRWFRAWRQLCNAYNTGAGATKEECEATVQIEMLNHQLEPVYYFDVKGCQYSGGNIGTLDGSAQDVLSHTLVMDFDLCDDREP